MMTRLAIRGALWGLALGALAPATTALVLVSHLAAPGVTLGSDLDLRFFFLYLPLLTGLVAVLQSTRHLLDSTADAFRRDLTAAYVVIGAVALVAHRVHGADVTDGEFRDAWLLVNGSLVLHVLATWAILRFALRDLASLHVARVIGSGQIDREATPRGGELPTTLPRDVAVVGLALQGLVRGVAISTTAGAAAGTVLVPGIGTMAGGYVGALYGLVPTIAGAVVLAAVVAVRRPTHVVQAHATISATLAVIGVGAMAWAWPFIGTALEESPWEGMTVLPMWLLALGVVWPMLCAASRHLTATYVRLTLGRRERAVVTA